MLNGACAMFTNPQLLPVVEEAISDPDMQHNVKVTVMPHPFEQYSCSSDLCITTTHCKIPLIAVTSCTK